MCLLKRIVVIALLLLLLVFPVLGEPIGTIVISFASETPDGYLPLDGEWYSVDDYPELAIWYDENYPDLVIDDQFYIPDFRGRVLAYAGTNCVEFLNSIVSTVHTCTGLTGGESWSLALFERGGERLHTMTVAEMPSHNHTLKDVQAPGILPFGSGYASLISLAGYNYLLTNNTGGGQAFNVLNPFVGVNYFMKAQPEIIILPPEDEGYDVIKGMAFVVAALTASLGIPVQALLYFLLVIYGGINDYEAFIGVTFMYGVFAAFTFVIRAVKGSGA